ncbi:PREDICTED: heterogeneous nuclear ribonucleoprotein U-like protein 1 [Ipomoea nil]|uniref:heterogeneous nuclear ribonucleoprotein U-like protein 1 n=1 Tax=Ipomoea nil TaxID=35883 RepID=UPI000900B49A|nr:PREDICTED: heterogeneous nuclear ribonucleoprotein U-like protein 1 [Ipomoea nil]
MATSSSSLSITDEHPDANKKLKITVAAGDQPSSQTPLLMPRRVSLNPADCDLDFCIEFNGLQGSGRYEKEFAYCWSGARADVGISGGKYCFGCKIIAYQPANIGEDDISEDPKNVCRVGVSRGDDGNSSSLGSLGETMNSFCIQSSREFCSGGRFCGYGERFEIGDTIVCCVDLEAKPASIGFSRNGRWMGMASQFDGGIKEELQLLQWQSAYFPHVLLKNVVVLLQFCKEDGLEPVEGYKPWASSVKDGKAFPGPILSPDVHGCDLIMMVGLPGSGKTTWAQKWAEDHPEKRYILLGENHAFHKMKVPSLLDKCNYDELFECWNGRAAKVFSALVSRASKLPRNFIVDHTNVHKGLRRHKLKPFANYHKVAVVVFPALEEFKSRVVKRYKELGREIPAGIINEALANFVLPMSKDMHGTDEHFDEVWFPELGRAESEKKLDEMKANMNFFAVLGEQTQSSSTPRPAGSAEKLQEMV